MQLARAVLLGSVALSAAASAAKADDPVATGAGIEALDTSRLAIEAAPSLPDAGQLPAMTGASPGDPSAAGSTDPAPEASPSAAPPAPPAISWSGYASSGLVYRSGK